MKKLLIISLLVVFCFSSYAKIWVLKDGTKINGEYYKANKDSVFFLENKGQKVVKVAKSNLSANDFNFLTKNIQSIEISKNYVKSQMALLNAFKFYSESDVKAREDILKILQKWLDLANKNEKKAIAGYSKLNIRLVKIYQKKEIVSYKYDKSLKKEKEVPVFFDVSKRKKRFFIQVGEDELSTIVPLSRKNISALLKAFVRVGQLKNHYRTEKKDGKKFLGKFGGISLNFVSKNKGQKIYLWMSVKAPFVDDETLQKQKVRLNIMNMNSLHMQLANSKSLLKKKKKKKR